MYPLLYTLMRFILYLYVQNVYTLTIKLFPHIRKNKNDYMETDEVSILLRLFIDNKRINISTGVKVQFQNWIDKWENTRKKNPIRDREPDSISKNLILKSKIKEVNDIIFDIQTSGGIITPEQIKTRLRTQKIRKQKESFKGVSFDILLEKYRDWILSDEYKTLTQNTDSYIRSLKSSIKDIIRWTEIYQNREGIVLTTEDIQNDYITGLITYCDKRGLLPSTIKKRIKVLVTFSKWIREELGINFFVKIPKKIFSENEKVVVCLSRDDVQTIVEFKGFEFSNKQHKKLLKKGQLEYIKDFTPKLKNIEYRILTSYEVYKDMLLFLCGTGMRFGDMVNIRVDCKEFDKEDRSKGEIMYRSEKTKRITRVPLNRLTDSIFNKYSNGKGREDYLFPQTKFGNSVSNTKFNKHIKNVCEIVGLNRLVKDEKFNLNKTVVKGSDIGVPLHSVVKSHIGRKTFIMEQVERGTPTRVIMDMTGHKSQKVFDGYYSIMKGHRMKNNEKIFSLNLTDEKRKTKDGISFHQEERLKKEKSLFDSGLVPKEVYLERVREILTK